MASVVLVFSAAARADNTILHEFAGGNDDGRRPIGYVTMSGSTIYGMTHYGGDSNYGVVFEINRDGSGYSNLHEFAGGNSDGRYPYGSLTLGGSALYGMTCLGGKSDFGVVFKMSTDGSGYSILHKFLGGGDDGNPFGSLTLNASTLYGMTYYGGDSDYGVVFKINTDGSGYSHLHEFAGGGGDGSHPLGSLKLDGSTLYGTTRYGGDYDHGVVFRMNTDGSSFELIHEFAGGSNDGKQPRDSLVVSGSTLYGMTTYGGDRDCGVVFKMNTDGSDYSLIHEFTGGGNDGSYPFGSLTLIGSTLYGTTSYGGDSDCGVVFRMNINGTGFELIHEFAGGSDDGEFPWFEQLALGDDGRLYGMTKEGGDSDYGVIYSVVPEPASAVLLLSGSVLTMLRRRRRH